MHQNQSFKCLIYASEIVVLTERKEGREEDFLHLHSPPPTEWETIQH